jgi:hypothetical protein
MRDIGVLVGDEVIVELTPEGPQRADLAEDISAALAANPAAAAFFDTLAQFYRKAYLRWIDATTRRPQVRAARILRSWTSSRPGSRSGHDRERNVSPPDGLAGIDQRTAPGEPRMRTGNRRPHLLGERAVRANAPSLASGARCGGRGPVRGPSHLCKRCN